MLASAKRDIDAKDYASANNRAYYAVFHAMRAVLALDGEDYKKHSAVIARFTLNYLRPEILPQKYSKLISNASLMRKWSSISWGAMGRMFDRGYLSLITA